MKRIRYAEPYMDKDDFEALTGSLKQSFETGWYGFGEKCTKFEQAFAKHIGTSHATFVNSGSSANLLAIATLVASGRIKKGDQAVTTACTFPTTLNPVLLYGLKPIFVDIDLPSWSINIEALKEAAESGAKLIVLPHLNGIPHDMDRVKKLASANSMIILEDACDALGSRFAGKNIGTFGELGTFSFYVAHHMTTGEGGMVVTNNEELGETVSSLRDWGRTPKIPSAPITEKRTLQYQTLTKDLPQDYESRYTYTHMGFNLKPLEMQGAWGLSQLQKLDMITEKRKMNFQRLASSLMRYRAWLTLPEPHLKADVSWFWLPIVVRDGAPFKRRDIVGHLEKAGIETRPVLAGNILKQPAYKNMDYTVEGELKNTERILQNGFIVGVHPNLSNDEIEYMSTTLQSFFENIHGD
jgi:CDP-6-deoxy-D-xylo-4-hexulose-3-dehydrase